MKDTAEEKKGLISSEDVARLLAEETRKFADENRGEIVRRVKVRIAEEWGKSGERKKL